MDMCVLHHESRSVRPGVAQHLDCRQPVDTKAVELGKLRFEQNRTEQVSIRICWIFLNDDALHVRIKWYNYVICTKIAQTWSGYVSVNCSVFQLMSGLVSKLLAFLQINL